MSVGRRRALFSIVLVGSLVAIAALPAGLASIDPDRFGAADVAPSIAASQLAPSAGSAILAVGAPTPEPGTPISPRRPGPMDYLVDSPPSVAPGGCADAPADATPARVASHGPRDRKVVALTFDDGYGPANTLKILAILQHFHVNATFFPTGRAVVLYPAVWQQVSDAGFPIGDHTYDHARLKGLCFAAQVRELTRQQRAVSADLGYAPMPLMRPPYGLFDRTTKLAARVAGDPILVLWDVDVRDWSGISASTVAKRALSGRSGSIVLMHTFPGATAAALPRIIAGYRARGYEFVTIGQLLGVAGPIPYG